MNLFQLTPLARARIWPDVDGTIFTPVGARRGVVPLPHLANTRPSTERVVLEAYIPRGARAEYGLLGLEFEYVPNADGVEIVVPYSTAGGPMLGESLAGRVDDVRVGLPEEYAEAVFTALLSSVTHPAGVVRVCGAAHGRVGSSSRFFARLATAAVALMWADSREPGLVVESLRRILL